jgi:hypothetical protein
VISWRLYTGKVRPRLDLDALIALDRPAPWL